MTGEQEQKQIDAASAVRRAVATGLLIKPERCSKCNQKVPSGKLHGHHADYSKPLEVEWLCWRCHARVSWFLKWFACVADWWKYCSENGIKAGEGSLPAMHKKTGMPLKKTVFQYWLAHLRKKR